MPLYALDRFKRFANPTRVDDNTHKLSCVCGEEKTENHTLGEWTLTKEATETEKGSRTKACACGHTVTEEIPALGSTTEAPNPPSGGAENNGENETENENDTPPANPDNLVPEPPVDNDGLSGGAIAGIAIGSTAAVALGGFAIFWFVIKKKKWSDLIGIFKK